MNAYKIEYTISEKGEIYKTGTIGVKHNKKSTPTDFKKYLKSVLPLTKKHLPISIVQFKNISEEECDREFGNETFYPK